MADGRSMKVTLFINIIFCFNLFAHSGGTIKSGPLIGCHNDRTRGEFHCHSQSKYNGMKFKSKEEAFAFTNKKNNYTSGSSAYDRGQWKHWTDKNGNCRDSRAEILIAESLVTPTLDVTGCHVISGKWNDFYYDEILTDPSLIDIDHVVPLEYAHSNGGMGWSLKEKEAYANDSLNIVITNQKYNRSKGSRNITKWLPANREYACKYMKRWFMVKEKYKLNISKDEQSTYGLAKCPNDKEGIK